MALTTLPELNLSLGIEDGTENAQLVHLLRRATAIIRDYTQRFHGGVIQYITAENPAKVTSIGHQLRTGDVIKIAGANATPSIDGIQTITKVDADTFTLDGVTVTTAGNCGFYGKRVTEIHSGTGDMSFFLRERPVQEIEKLWLDQSALYGDESGAFPDADLLTAGVDYALEHDGDGLSRSGRVVRARSYWPHRAVRVKGLITQHAGDAQGNIKVQFIAGWIELPDSLKAATEAFVAELLRSINKGGPMQSESLDYYSYTRASAEEENKALSSIKSMLKRHKTWNV